MSPLPWRTAWVVLLHPPHLRRTLLIALVIGSWLTLINLGDQWWWGPRDGVLCLRTVLNLLTPFVVANLGLLARAPHSEAAAAPAIQD